MALRFIIAAVVLLGIQFGVRWVQDRGVPTETAPIEMKAEDLPKTLGDWKGEDVALDEDLFNHIGAETVIDRTYKDHLGRAVSLHLAVFKHSKGVIIELPHCPEECYPGSGWQLGDPKSVALDDVAATQNLAKFSPVERQGQTNYIVYWYQVDGVPYFSRDRSRNLLLTYRGRPVLPPVVKVLLHSSAANADEAEKTLQSLAGEVFKWTKEFH